MRTGAARTLARHLPFAVLIIFAVARTLDHAMWRDEMRAWSIAIDSATLADLFRHVRHESHPALWYAVVWTVTRVTDDPVAMQVAHILIAVATWMLLYVASPFDRRERLALVLGYFFFWEYFVLSRSYALMALLGLGVVALRVHRPRSVWLAWLLLGLLANTAVYGTIWSIALAAGVALEQRRSAPRALAAGGVVYVLLLTFAVATMAPVGTGVVRPPPTDATTAFLIGIPIDALAPFPLSWLKGMWALANDPAHASLPRFWNPVPIHALASALHLDEHPLLAAGVLVAGLVIGIRIIGEPRTAAQFALGYGGVVLFAWRWGFPGHARHHGVVLLMLIAAVWTVRAREPRAARSPLWSAVLVLHVFAGLTTLTAELQPFSEGRNVARWLRESGLADGLLLGSEDLKVATVAGYLRRPVYSLECECTARVVVASPGRESDLDPVELGRRVVRAVDGVAAREAVLVLNHELASATAVATASSVSFTLARGFTRAAVPGERYFVYRVTPALAP